LARRAGRVKALSAGSARGGEIWSRLAVGRDTWLQKAVMPAATDDAHVRFEDVHMAFEGRAVLRGLSCGFPRGKISVILGGSGSGKTTVLRLIGGLVHPQRGRIVVAGHDISELSEIKMYTVRKKLGMMFQGGALLNSLTIFDNLAFPLREHTSLREAQIADEVHRQLAEVGLAGVDHLLPGQLSGGMIKRAALARAIITKPEILLCDEPFSGLDPISVKRIEALLNRVNQQLSITMLVSSHHIPSTMRMADQVVLLLPDEAVTGAPAELQQRGDPRVAGFFNEDVDESTEGPEVDMPGERVTHRWVES
jgi:phospholipid/cholesterol/gamma-HCH transport system ATP-binding protein